MLLYAISSRKALPGDDVEQRRRLVELALGWASGGVDYIQIREKDLPLPELQSLAAQVVEAVRSTGSSTRVLLNGPAQVALAAGADGVHLPSTPGLDPTGNPQMIGTAGTAVRAADGAYERAGREAVVSAACHSPEEIRRATGASLLLFSPVFEKVSDKHVTNGQGLAALRAAVELAAPTPIVALGGVTEKNAAACVQNGAAGIAAIRLFIGDGWRSLVEAPKATKPAS
jgi:thiamine-phosphate pyrophosphorylase